MIKRMKSLRVYLLTLILFLFSVSFVSSTIADIDIIENGILSDNTTLNTTINFESGLDYEGVRIFINSDVYYESYINSTQSYSNNFTIPVQHVGLIEETVINKSRNYVDAEEWEQALINGDLQEINVSYNLTNLFTTDINLTVRIPFPDYSNFNFTQYSMNITPTSTYNNSDYFEFNYTLLANQKIQYNISYNTSHLIGYITFPAANYSISIQDYVMNTYDVKTLIDVVHETKKEMKNLPETMLDTTPRNWTVDFSLENTGDLTFNITSIQLWANPINNLTANPNENLIFSNSYPNCLIGDSIITPGEICTQSNEFTSEIVPVVWSSYDYVNLFDFNLLSNYSYTGLSQRYPLSGFLVFLTNPKNMTMPPFDVNETVDFEFFVSESSNCTFFHNMSTIFMQSGLKINNVTSELLGSTLHNVTFNYTMPSSEMLFRWNMFCEANEGKKKSFAYTDNYIYVNAIPRPRIAVPDLIWNEDTNITILGLDYFYDFENDDFNISINPDTIQNISYFVDNVTKTITFVPNSNWFGEKLVRLVATDEFGRNVTSNLFKLSVVNVYDPPVINWWNVSNSTWYTVDSILNVSENDSFRFEADADDADITADNEFDNAPGSWFYWFLDGILQSIGKTFDWDIGWFDSGSHEVQLVVNDSENLISTKSWTVNVSNLNRLPYYDTISDIMWRENTVYLIDLNSYFHDLDLENLDYSLSSVMPSNITVEINNSLGVARFIPDADWIGTRTVSFIAVDPYGGNVTSNVINLEVFPHILEPMPDITFLEDGYNDTLDLQNYYNLAEYNFSDFSWLFAYDSSKLNVVMGTNFVLNISAAKDWFGNESLTIIVNNTPTNYLENYTIDVIVDPVNDMPILNSTIITIPENQQAPYNLIDLWSLTYDVDNHMSSLLFNIENNSDSNLLDCLVLANRYVNCTGPAINTWGNIKLNISVNDTEYLVSNSSTIIVYHEDLLPEIYNWSVVSPSHSYMGSVSQLRINLNENEMTNWSVNVRDYENNTLAYYWVYDNNIEASGIINDSLNLTNLIYSRSFDYHSAGNHTLRLRLVQLSGDIPNQESYVEWELDVLNVNRPPGAASLLLPVNNLTLFTSPIRFEWMKSDDPDYLGYTNLDYWDVEYMLQIDDLPNFINPELDLTLTNHLMSAQIFYELSSGLNDGTYFWRVVATDGDMSSVSETRAFVLDFNYPNLTLDVMPEAAEFLYRDVTIAWSATDTFLANSSVKITFPDGSLLGTYYTSPILLTPTELTQIGVYDVELSAVDNSNNFASMNKNLIVFNDNIAPEVNLITPINNFNSASKTVLFVFESEDYPTLAKCDLYYQKVSLTYDTSNNIISEVGREPWELKDSLSIFNRERSYFLVENMFPSSYKWNVFCTDLAGNIGTSPSSGYFNVLFDPPEEKPEYIRSDSETNEVSIESNPGYNLIIDVPVVNAEPGEVIEVNMVVSNVGLKSVNELTFKTSNDAVDILTSVEKLLPGESITVPYRMRVPYDLSDFSYHIVAESQNLRLITPGYTNVAGGDNSPMILLKDVSLDGDDLSYYTVNLKLINPTFRTQRIYIEDYLIDMGNIAYDDSLFTLNPSSPESLIYDGLEIGPEEQIELSYKVGDLDLTKIKKPFVMTDHDIDIELRVVSSRQNNTNLNLKTGRKFNLLSLIFILIIISLSYLAWLNRFKLMVYFKKI